jgi:RNA polymerase sigma-70 factor (ECF subfamily)
VKDFVTDSEEQKTYAKTLGKGTLMLGDMFAGIPGQALALGANLGGRLAATAAGENRRTVELAGEAGEELIPEWMKTPLQTASKILGGGDPMDQSKLSGMIQDAANIAEKASSGLVSEADAKLLFNMVMLKGGAHAVDAGVKGLTTPKAKLPEGAITTKAGLEADRAKATDIPDKGGVVWDDAGPNQPATEAREPYRQPVAPLEAGGLTPEEAIAASKQRIKDAKAAVKEETPVDKAARMEATIVPNGPATWLSGGVEYPIEVTGEPVKGPDGKMYTPAKVNGTDTWVPTGELNGKVTVPRVEPQVGLPEPAEPTVPKTRLQDGQTLEELKAGSPLDSALDKMRRGQDFDIDAVEKVAVQNTMKAGGRIVGLDGKPIGSGFQDGNVDPRLLAALGLTSAAIWAALNPEDMEKLGTLGLIGATTLTGKGRALEVLLKESRPYTDPVFEHLSGNKIDFAKQEITDRFGKTSGEAKKVFERVLATVDGDRISAHDLVSGWVAETSGWRMTTEESGKYASYGLEKIGREVPARREGGNIVGGRDASAMQDVTSTLFRLPEHMEMSDANHFGDSRLFGWTRSFKEDGVTHVVEVQSDLAQHVKELSPEQFVSLVHGQAAIAEQLKILGKPLDTWLEGKGRFGGELDNVIKHKAELLKANPDAIFKIEEAILERLPNAAKDRLNSYGNLATEGGVLDAVKALETDPQILRAARDGISAFEEALQMKRAENRAAMDAGAAAGQLSPILKNWPRRLIREQLNKSAEKGEGYVRFASADTVAKVEGWPREELRKIFGDAELQQMREIAIRMDNVEALAEFDKLEADRKAPQPFKDPGHQSIYNRYAGEITRYYKSLGGVEFADAQGHTWWQVPVDSVVIGKGADMRIKMLGSADPKLLAAIAGGIGLGAYLLSPDNKSMLTLAGIGLGVAGGKGGMKAMLEADLLKTAREGGPKAQQAFTELYTRNAPQLERSLHSFERTGISIPDIVQRSFEKVFARINNFEENSKLSTYLYRTAQNEAKNAIRNMKVRPETSEMTPEMEETLGHDVTPASIAQNKLLGERMTTALEKVEPSFREAFLMREADGLSYEEIADRTGVPIGTVRSRISRAKDQLQRYLHDYADATGQRGAATPEQMVKLAGVVSATALGAYLDSKHPVEGALLGFMGGVLVAGAKPKAIGEFINRMQNEAAFLDVGKQILASTYNKWASERAAYSFAERMYEEHPVLARREAIYKYLEGEEPQVLTAAELKTAEGVKAFFEERGAAAKKAGVIREVIDNYATRIYGKEALGWLRERSVGDFSTSSPFGKSRAFPTRALAEANGYKVISMDIAKVMEEYNRSVTDAIENRNLVKALREHPTGFEEGQTVIMKEGKAPRDYMFIDHPQLRGFRVHPDTVGDLRMLFDSFNPGAILRMLDVINTTQKRATVSMSLFHAAAITHAAIGAMPLRKGIPMAAQNLAQTLGPRGLAIVGGGIAGSQMSDDHSMLGMVAGMAAGGAIGKYIPHQILGENTMLKQLRSGEAGDMIDTAAKYGFRPGFERAEPTIADLQGNYYQAIGGVSAYLDKVVPGLGNNTVGKYQDLMHATDSFMFGRLMPATKIMIMMDKVRELSRNNARDVEAGRAALKSEKEVYTSAISFADDMVGGQNYVRLVQELQSRWSRSVASAALGPTGQFLGRMSLFAMDWTLSTSRGMIKAFSNQGKVAATGAIVGSQLAPDDYGGMGAVIGGLAGLVGAKVGGIKGGEGSGVRGLWHPTELADLHRQYLMRSAFVYTAAIDWLNVQNTGHHFWENNNSSGEWDPTRLQNADGTTTQVSKHFWEPMHWLLAPRQQLMNKSSFLVKESVSQMEGVEYWSTHKAPKMGNKPLKEGMTVQEMQDAKRENPTLGDRVAHAGRAFTPISFQDSGESQGIGGMLGSPTYGRSYTQAAEARAAGKRLHESPEYKALAAAKKAKKGNQ